MAPLLLCQRYEGYGVGLSDNIQLMHDLYPFSARLDQGRKSLVSRGLGRIGGKTIGWKTAQRFSPVI